MSWKSTLVLLVIALVLLGYLKYFENGRPVAPAGPPHLVILDRNQMTGLTITNHDLKVDLHRQPGGEWMMTSPLNDRADVGLINEVMSDLETAVIIDKIPAGEIVSNKSKLADFGLQAPRLHLQITPQNGKSQELIFGNDTVIPDKTYLQVAGRNDVYVVGSALKKAIDKDANAWRDHRVMEVAATDVTRLIIKNSAGEMELRRTGDHWQITKPLNARANEQKVTDLASQLTTLTIGSFVADDKADAAAYGLADPRGMVTVYSEKDPKGVELIIGAPKTVAPANKDNPAAAAIPSVPAPDGSIYVRVPARQSIYTLAKGVEDFLNLKPNDVRDRALTHLNADTVDRIKVARADGEAFTVARKDKEWTVLAPPADLPANPAAATRLMEGFNNAQVAAFVADTASDLAKYGLDKPSLKVTFSAFASENTAETGAGDKPLATVSFGKVEEPNVYVRVEEEPFVLSVPKAVLEAVPTDRTQWQPLNIYEADPDKIGSISISEQGRPDLAMTRGDKGGWTLTKGKGPLDENKAQSVANTLARLHAVRWAAPAAVPPASGLETPAFATIRFETPNNPRGSGVLTLGHTGPENMGFARVEGKPGTFLVSRPDYDTLLQALVPEAAPAPTPEAPAAFATPTSTPAGGATPSTTSDAAAMPLVTPLTTPVTAATPVATPLTTPVTAATPVATPLATPVIALPIATVAPAAPSPAESPAPSPNSPPP